jgi:hypothetical protein
MRPTNFLVGDRVPFFLQDLDEVLVGAMIAFPGLSRRDSINGVPVRAAPRQKSARADRSPDSIRRFNPLIRGLESVGRKTKSS